MGCAVCEQWFFFCAAQGLTIDDRGLLGEELGSKLGLIVILGMRVHAAYKMRCLWCCLWIGPFVSAVPVTLISKKKYVREHQIYPFLPSRYLPANFFNLFSSGSSFCSVSNQYSSPVRFRAKSYFAYQKINYSLYLAFYIVSNKRWMLSLFPARSRPLPSLVRSCLPLLSAAAAICRRHPPPSPSVAFAASRRCPMPLQSSSPFCCLHRLLLLSLIAIVSQMMFLFATKPINP